MANRTRSGGWIARRSGGSEAHAVNNPGCSVQLPSVWRRSPAPFVRCPGSRLEQSTFSNALLECLLEILQVGQSPYLLRRRNKAVVAVSVREVRLGWKFVRHHVNPTRAG